MNETPTFRYKAPKALHGPVRGCVIRRLIENSRIVNRGGWKCWEWQGATDKDGYGRINVNSCRRGLMVHRVSFVAFVRDLEDGETVNHRCLNRRCINPDHFNIMSQGANTAEANGRRWKKEPVPF